jgi:hypothetical protein
MIVDNDDSRIRKRKCLNVGYFDGPFLSMIVHFLVASSGVRTAWTLFFILMLVTPFFERYLWIVGGDCGKNPVSMSNSLGLKVTTVFVLPGLRSRKEFISEKPFCHFSRKKS